jgi:hypothetical protein
VSGKGNEAYEKLDREITAKYGHLFQRINPNAPVGEFKPAPEVILCPAQTYRQTRDNPAEYCENEVEEYGDFCDKHDEQDRADADYDNYKESRHDD